MLRVIDTVPNDTVGSGAGVACGRQVEIEKNVTVDITVRRVKIEDGDFLNHIFTHPTILPHLVDDYCTGVEKVDWGTVINAPGVYLLIVQFDGKDAAVFFAHPWNSVCWEGHSLVLPAYRGRVAIHLAKAAMEKFFIDNPRAVKIVTFVPAFNRRAYAFAIRMGFKLVWNNEKSFMKNGILHNQYLFEYRRQ